MNWQISGQILVQGLKGIEVISYITQMLEQGAKIVAGIDPSQEQDTIEAIPIFALVEEAIAEVGEISTSLIFVHPYKVLDAATEAIVSGIKQLIIFSQGVPPLDMIRLLRIAKEHDTLILGSGSGGILIPGELSLGIWSTEFYQPGRIGILTDSPNLSYEVALALQKEGLGESIVISIGQDAILGTNFEFWLEFLHEHEKTEEIALITRWERIELELINYIKKELNKPVIIYGYDLQKKGHTYLSNIVNIMANQLFSGLAIQELETTVKDLLTESDILLVNNPSQIRDLLKCHKAV
ncbi:MAG: CoA-binding protein [Gloeocapsa sp. DLM2.Bin57]|nr:MAG: CoA-binding protein [Gloeocapsa sp. DLM2.Bin57]